MDKRILLLTGKPGIGKTTTLLKIVDLLKEKGYTVGGMISREVRSGGSRIGFEILDLGTGRRGWLAHINQKSGPQVGKYHVNLEDLEGIGVAAISNAIKSSHVIIVDEVGPMELFSEKFKQTVGMAVESKKLLVAVVHWRAREKLIDEVKGRRDAEIFEVTYANRDRLHEAVAEKAIKFLESRS
ncbi:MAG: NTPase [Candidatus Bathyarchaeia archaeon]